ncbi:8-amino-7-oxononanoate synthase [Paenibacillus athensensis]|uniref:8-amino-7-ketopelargonate synthase n=2 Tax=Paenibacillus athensensis TaxID=1967502 RepID=A0A4Y8PY25_9BACL|nr:8-amino-7-oxononanoate synthase [Paenibacillus athensensis]
MRAELDTLRVQSQYRTLTDSIPLAHGWIERHGKRMLNLASNHYLGLPHLLDETQLAAALGNAAGQVSTGSTASRLIVGNDPVFAEFEREFAAFKGTEGCLLYGSGYMANVGVISALVGRRGIVFSDRLNHASIVDGIVLSRAEHKRYRHRDLDQLERLLCAAEPGARKLIVTDSVFSMDGSLAPLKELVWLKERYGAHLMVDEAHSGGVFGERGEGLTHALGLTGAVDIQMGTFSKAYGCYGAYVAGDRTLIDYLVNHSRSLIYTTALPPMVVRAVRHNWRLACEAAEARRQLAANAAAFREALQTLGFDTGASECHIVPLLVGGNEATLRLSERLQERGIAAVAIRPPTVPEGTARIRFTLTAAHRPEDLQQAAAAIGESGRELGLIS